MNPKLVFCGIQCTVEKMLTNKFRAFNKMKQIYLLEDISGAEHESSLQGSREKDSWQCNAHHFLY